MIYVCSSWCHCQPIMSCFIKIHNGLTFLIQAYPGCPGKKAIKSEIPPLIHKQQKIKTKATKSLHTWCSFITKDFPLQMHRNNQKASTQKPSKLLILETEHTNKAVSAGIWKLKADKNSKLKWLKTKTDAQALWHNHRVTTSRQHKFLDLCDHLHGRQMRDI